MIKDKLREILYKELQGLVPATLLGEVVNRIQDVIPPESVEEVREFHSVFQPANIGVSAPTNIPMARRLFRLTLIEEEVKELKEALTRTADYYEPHEVLDALCDIQYVLDGTFIELGMHNIKSKACSIVHKSNMSKLSTTGESLKQTLEKYKNIKTLVTNVEGYGAVVYRSDGKVLKSSEFVLPNFNNLWDKP